MGVETGGVGEGGRSDGRPVDLPDQRGEGVVADRRQGVGLYGEPERCVGSQFDPEIVPEFDPEIVPVFLAQIEEFRRTEATVKRFIPR